MCLYQVLYTYLCQLLLSLMGICYPNKLLISDIRITSSYLTTNFLYSYVLPYQVPFSVPTFSLLHRSCSDYPLQYSFQLFISASPSYSYQLLLSATCNRQTLLLCSRSATVSAFLTMNQSFRLQFSGIAVKQHYHILRSSTCISYYYQVLLPVTRIYSSRILYKVLLSELC